MRINVTVLWLKAPPDVPFMRGWGDDDSHRCQQPQRSADKRQGGNPEAAKAAENRSHTLLRGECEGTGHF